MAGNTGRKEITLNNLKANAEELVGAVLPDSPSNMGKEPARGFTPAEIEDMVYNHPGRPPEGVDANWLKCTLNVMARYKQIQTSRSDCFEHDEVERWFNDFGPDEVLSAFRRYIDRMSDLSRGVHPLDGFRIFICMLCTDGTRTGATSIESHAYSVGKLKDARRKELGIGKNNEKPQA